MANAKKCDRCGRLYKARMSIPDITILKYRHPYGEDRIDLCDDCQEQLEDWLKNSNAAFARVYNLTLCENCINSEPNGSTGFKCKIHGGLMKAEDFCGEGALR